MSKRLGTVRGYALNVLVLLAVSFSLILSLAITIIVFLFVRSIIGWP